VSCRHHLALEITRYGSIRVAVEGNPVSFDQIADAVAAALPKLKETCVLDVAARGPITLEEIGELVQLTRERVRQVEEPALRKVRRAIEAENAEHDQ
jgi:hypothetical protein